MKIFIDTNIFLDILFKREGYREALDIVTLCEEGLFQGVIADITLLNIDYIAAKQMQDIRGFLAALNGTFQVVGADNQLFEDALARSHNDLEDVIQCLCAIHTGCKLIITNDKKFYATCNCEIVNAKRFIEQYEIAD